MISTIYYMPEWKRWNIKEAKDVRAAESLGWASKDHGFGYEYFIPSDENTWATISNKTMKYSFIKI